MRSQAVLVVVLGLVVAGAWFLFTGQGDLAGPQLPGGAEPVATTGAGDAARGDTAHAAATAQVPGGDDDRADAQRTVVAPTAPAAAADAAACTVSGRLVGRDGRPRADVEVSWSSWRTNGALGDVPIGPVVSRGDDADRRVRSGADGRFEFPMARGHAGDLRTARRDELVLAKGSVRFSTASGSHDLGDVEVQVPVQVRGVVVDAAGQPVEGVTVGADTGAFGVGLRSETATAADGSFAVGALHPGPWTLRTASDRFLPATVRLDLGPEEVRDDVRLVVERGQAIAGQVIDDRGVPVAGASVAARRTERSPGVSIQRFSADEATKTDANGFFTLGGLTDETVAVRAQADGHDQAVASSVRVGTGNVVLEIARLATIAGVLKDTAGQPIAGSRITAVAADDRNRGAVFDLAGVDVAARHRAITAENGAFRLEGVRPGTSILRADGDGHRPVEQAGIVLRPAEVLEGVTLIADIGAVLTALVVDEAGAPVPGARVEVRTQRPAQPSGSVFRRAMRTERREAEDDGEGPDVRMFDPDARPLGSAETDEHGVVLIAGLPAGDVEVVAEHPKFAPSPPVAAVLPVRGAVSAELHLRKPGVAQLVVTGPDGAARAAQFVLRGPLGETGSPATHKGASGADGRAEVDRLPAGRYTAELELPAPAQHLGGGMSFVVGGNERGLPSTRVEFLIVAGEATEVPLRMPQLTRVHGTVTGLDGPVAGVTIELQPTSGDEPVVSGVPGMGGPTALSDRDGAFAIDSVQPGSYRISWGKPEQVARAHADIEVLPDQAELRQDLRLRYGALRVQVVTAEDGEPIEGAEVELVEAAGAGGAPAPQRRMMMISMTVDADSGGSSDATSMTMGAPRATTDVDGVVELDDVPPGRYSVRVTHPRFAAARVDDQTVTDSGRTDAGRVELAAAGRLRGRVVDADGQPVGMALVQCRRVGAGADPDAQPDRQPAMGGAFTFGGLTPGRYAVSATAIGPGGSGDEGQATEVDVVAGKTVSDVEVRLGRQ
ncbi:MAG: carboxypeptidase regulatory-like domain-containing protein [Planctomycetota bacterium]